MADLEWHDFGLKKASKNSIVPPTLKIYLQTQFIHGQYHPIIVIKKFDHT